MERAAWTDERLDDLSDAVRTGFARVDGDIRGLRVEMRDGFSELRTEINELRRVMLGVGGGIVVALIGVIAAISPAGCDESRTVPRNRGCDQSRMVPRWV